jgi:hypothetical protein
VGVEGHEPNDENATNSGTSFTSDFPAGADSGAVRVRSSKDPVLADPPSPVVAALLALAAPLSRTDRETLARLLLAEDTSKGDADETEGKAG